jgi:hypothetical protein
MHASSQGRRARRFIKPALVQHSAVEKGSAASSMAVVVVARGRVSAEELFGASFGIGFTLEAIHLHFEFAFALVETPDLSP